MEISEQINLKKGQHDLLIELIRYRFDDIPFKYLSIIEQVDGNGISVSREGISKAKALEKLSNGLNDKSSSTQMMEK
jgi:hypothetical protein